MAGTWRELPSNCTRDIGLTYRRCLRLGTYVFEQCLQWGMSVIQTCAKWADDGYTSCGHWSDQGSNHCCTWWPCSWGCKAFYWVAKWVCDFFVWVANFVCLIFVVLAFWACLLATLILSIACLVWAWIEVWFCLSKADGGTALLLTDGTVLMQECELGQGTRRWWRLHPDETGSYVSGVWSRAAESHVARKYFASAVLADGRVIVAGGEYSDAGGFNIEDDTKRHGPVIRPVRRRPSRSPCGGSHHTVSTESPARD